MQPRLSGKIAIVTGSDSGIGQATAEEFAEQGADIVVVYLHDRGGAEETRRRVEAAGRRALVSLTDVRNEHSVVKLLEETEAKLWCSTYPGQQRGDRRGRRPRCGDHDRRMGQYHQN